MRIMPKMKQHNFKNVSYHPYKIEPALVSDTGNDNTPLGTILKITSTDRKPAGERDNSSACTIASNNAVI